MMPRPLLRTTLGAACVSLLLFPMMGCDARVTMPSISIRVAGDSVVRVGSTIRLDPVLRDTLGLGISADAIVWQSSDPSVAFVRRPHAGVAEVEVTGLAAGATTITATAPVGKSAGGARAAPRPPGPTSSCASSWIDGLWPTSIR